MVLLLCVVRVLLSFSKLFPCDVVDVVVVVVAVVVGVVVVRDLLVLI